VEHNHYIYTNNTMKRRKERRVSRRCNWKLTNTDREDKRLSIPHAVVCRCFCRAFGFSEVTDSTKESGNFPSMKGMTKKKSRQIEDKGGLSLPTGDDSVVSDSTVRQLTKCSSRASTKNFSTMCFVCAKGRLVKADEDVCRFEGTL
jgi:hypothetical protein